MNFKNENDYTKLKRKTYIKGIRITIIAAGVIIVIRYLSYGKLADGIINILVNEFGFDYYDVVGIYDSVVSGNIEMILAIVIIVFMLILFRMLLKSYTKYFDEVVDGIDKISFENKGIITLSPELKSVEKKLNNLNNTLIRQDKETKKAEQQKNDMVVYLAHDIKTPLTSILGYLSLIEVNEKLPEEKKDKYVHIAFQKAERLESLVNEFFEITQYSLQSVPLKKEKIDFYYMMVQISEELHPLFLESGHSIIFDIPENMRILGNPEKLARVFYNIIKNAIAYSNKGSKIKISAREKDDMIIIKIKSHGAIPSKDLEIIFQKFSRLNDARSSSTGGSGLGLAIAKDIIRLHSGKIYAGCDDENTTFTIELPICGNT